MLKTNAITLKAQFKLKLIILKHLLNSVMWYAVLYTSNAFMQVV